ncbi:MAG TPA: energy transducer TonB, partial [Bacteroidales bacterium]|nr:energy transducer TonB [Bacteroidales bacterium]
EVMEEVQEEEPEPEPFIVVEEMPMFPGGETELLRYISDNTVYPEVAKENNIQGRVIVRFCVTSKGSVDQISVLKGVDAELDKEAMRVVSTLPPFRPGKQGGKPVPVWYMVPITFTLK